MKTNVLALGALLLSALPGLTQGTPPPVPPGNAQPPAFGAMQPPPSGNGQQPPAFGGNQPPAGNMQQQIVGTWNCEWGFRNTRPGQPANAVGGQFQMQIDAQGNVWGQGYDMGSSGSFPMQFQGRYRMQGNEFMAEGMAQGGMALSGGGQWTFQTRVYSGTQMSYTHQYQNGQVYASQCYRVA